MFSNYQATKKGLLYKTYNIVDIKLEQIKLKKAINSKSNNIELKNRMINLYKENIEFLNRMINQQILES